MAAKVYFDTQLNSILVAFENYYEYMITDALDNMGILKPPCKHLVYKPVPTSALLLGDL